MNRAGSWFCKIFLVPSPLVKWLFIKEIKGKENIPQRNFILASNHQSYLDILFGIYLVVPRRFHFIGQLERSKIPLKWFVAFIYFISGVIPLDKKNKHYSRWKIIEKAVKVLKRGRILIIYPEGRRSLTGQIQEGKSGTARIFLKTNVPILPVGIKGAFELLSPKGKLKIKRQIQINIGQLLFFREEFARAQNLAEDSPEYQVLVEKITKKIMEEINKLCKEL